MEKNNTKKIREPLIHITKRPAMSFWQAAAIRLCAIALGFIFCALLSAVLIKASPIKFVETMIDGSFGNSRRIWKLLKDVSVLLCISLAVTPAFKMRFWNIGAEGQVLMGALASVGCVIYLGDKITNQWLLLGVMLLAAVVISAVWAVIPAIFRAFWNTNETLFTLMMNYIATYFVSFFLIKWVKSGSSSLGELKKGHLPVIKGTHEYLLLIISVLVLTVLMYIYLNYSKHGYELSVVGESVNTAKYIGINVKKVVIRTLIVSGIVCGIAGFLIVSALDHTVSETTVGGQGFTAIIVSWLAKFNPLFMILASFLVIFLEHGSDQISTHYEISNALPNMVVAVVLFFIIGCEFFINYKINFRKAKGADDK